MSTFPRKIQSVVHTATQNLSDLSPDAVAAMGDLYGGDPKCIAAVKMLDGRIFAMLTPNEEGLLNYYRDRGRKWGVAIKIVNDADATTLVAVSSRQEADQILKSANSKISVTIQ